MSGCGARTNLLGAQSRRQATPSASLTLSAPATDSEVRVIRGWSEALRRGDVTGAAAYFAVPSQMINGSTSGQGVLLRIQSRHDALLANESLPCGAKLISAVQHGRFVAALFVLTARTGPGGSPCAGSVGARAQTFFLIVGGRIRAWIRAPEQSAMPGPVA